MKNEVLICQEYVDEHSEVLLRILDKLRSSFEGKQNDIIKDLEKEIIFKKNKILRACEKASKNLEEKRKFYSISHEIRSMDLFMQYPEFSISLDSKSEPGPDIRIGNYAIECVCSSKGNLKLLKENAYGTLSQLGGKIVVDNYIPILYLILSRFTSSLKEKRNKYFEYLNNNVLKDSDPYIIILGIGELSYNFHDIRNYGGTLLNILFSVGNEVNGFDQESGKLLYFYNIRRDFIEKEDLKSSKAIINADLFLDNPEYECVSAVIFCTAELNENYNYENSFLFLNPNAKNKIDLNLFSNFIYWETKDKVLIGAKYRGISLPL